MKTCIHCQKSFTIDPEDNLFYEKMGVPEPTHCPDCRQQRRMAWRNERFLFSRKCNKTNESIVSMYPEDVPFPVYHNREWWKDDWDAILYGRDFDGSKGLFEQMKELQNVVPRMHRFCYAEERMINSEFTNCSGDMKDCYLVFASSQAEKSLYSIYLKDCVKCCDCFFVLHSELCYECTDCEKCYDLKFSNNCSGCHSSMFLEDCRACSDCIACVGLRQKKYHVLNQSYSKEEYEKINNALIANNYQDAELLASFEKLKNSLPKKYIHGEKNENCSGDYIWNSKNCSDCFDTAEAEDCKYCTWFVGGKNCMDYFAWGQAELSYEISGGGYEMYQCAFTAMSYACKFSMYLDQCVYCEHCFGCVGLNKKKYCILNKQYTKEEYEVLVPKIVEKMRETFIVDRLSTSGDGLNSMNDKRQTINEFGEFFPASMSPFAYNKSVAIDRYPLTEAQALFEGLCWIHDKENTGAGEVLERVHISQVSDDITGKVLKCAESGKSYKVTAQELQLYRELQVPIPNVCLDVRYLKRLRSRNSYHLHERQCAKCSKVIKTSYSKEKLEIVYCEECYLGSVY